MRIEWLEIFIFNPSTLSSNTFSMLSIIIMFRFDINENWQPLAAQFDKTKRIFSILSNLFVSSLSLSSTKIDFDFYFCFITPIFESKIIENMSKQSDLIRLDFFFMLCDKVYRLEIIFVYFNFVLPWRLKIGKLTIFSSHFLYSLFRLDFYDTNYVTGNNFLLNTRLSEEWNERQRKKKMRRE